MCADWNAATGAGLRPATVLRRNLEIEKDLSPELLGEFLRKLDAIDTSHEQTRIAMLLVVLTACRKTEVNGG